MQQLITDLLLVV